MKLSALLSACGLLMAWDAMATKAVFTRQEPTTKSTTAEPTAKPTTTVEPTTTTTEEPYKPDKLDLRIEADPDYVDDGYLSANESCEITTVNSNPNCVLLKAFSNISSSWKSACIIKGLGKDPVQATSSILSLPAQYYVSFQSTGCEKEYINRIALYNRIDLWKPSNRSSWWRSEAIFEDDLYFHAQFFFDGFGPGSTLPSWNICFEKIDQDIGPSDCDSNAPTTATTTSDAPTTQGSGDDE